MENKRVSIFFSLFGIDCRMVYVNRKYYFGLMWGGVIRGLVGVKFFGFFKRFGENSVNSERENNIIIKLRRFLFEK